MKSIFNYIKKVIISFAQRLQFILWHVPISVTALAGLYFSFRLLANPESNTINITNYTFAVVAAFSAISFSFARTIENDKETRSMVQYCAERFLHSSILFIVASIVKFFLIQTEVIAFASRSKLAALVFVLINIMPGVLYLGSVTSSVAALRELNALLYSRKKPGHELIKLF